jgi:hypothetical protein
MDDTAMSSAEVADVTAKKSKIKRAAAPDLPRRALAAAAAGRPAETSASGRYLNECVAMFETNGPANLAKALSWMDRHGEQQPPSQEWWPK